MRTCVYTVLEDPAYDDFVAVKVYMDGNPIRLGRFKTRDEAEDFIDSVENNERGQ